MNRPLRQSSAARRNLISARTVEALAAKRAAGVRLGRPRRCPDQTLAMVVQLRLAGRRLIDIAESMNKTGVPTPGGSTRWYASHVSRLLTTQDGQRLLTARQENQADLRQHRPCTCRPPPCTPLHQSADRWLPDPSPPGERMRAGNSVQAAAFGYQETQLAESGGGSSPSKKGHPFPALEPSAPTIHGLA